MDPYFDKSAADIPDEFKTTLAKLYEFLHENGVTRALFLEGLKYGGYSVGTRTLDRWVHDANTRGTAILEFKESGGIPRLDSEQRNVTSGWVLHENGTGVEVTLLTFFDFVKTYFNIELSDGTISNYLTEDGFASRLVKRKGTSFVVDVDALCQLMWNWVIIQDFRARRIQRDKFASIDFTFTGHRTERGSSYAPNGGPQPMVADSISKYTNCIITCAWADGINRTPPILFTYNSAFRTDRNVTKRRKEQVDHLHECMDKYGISADRIKYVGNNTNETRTYVKECPELVRLFFEEYEVPPDVTIYSDEGNSFFEEDKSVLNAIGFKHICYEPLVHQYTSVNDNPLHGSSKQKWRHCGVDYKDDVASCLALLSFLDEDITHHSKYWWDRNMISITEEGVRELIGQRPGKLSHLHKSWKRSYEEFMNQFEEVDE